MNTKEISKTFKKIPYKTWFTALYDAIEALHDPICVKNDRHVESIEYILTTDSSDLFIVGYMLRGIENIPAKIFVNGSSVAFDIDKQKFAAGWNKTDGKGLNEIRYNGGDYDLPQYAFGRYLKAGKELVWHKPIKKTSAKAYTFKF